MDNYHLHVIAVVLYFNLPGSVGAKSQQILPATHRCSECRWDGQLLLNCSFTRMSTVPEDTPQTALIADLSYNNIKTFVCSDGRNEEWMLKHLNLSNNLISELTLTTCTNLPNLETLNLSGNAIHTLTLEMPAPAHGSKKYSIVDRLLPALKVLSVERNNLNTVPRGLGLLQSLQTVHMSSNAIQQIDQKDFQNCSQLKDIDLRNNKITKIHPDAFRDLNKLQVVDLRENALTIPLPQILVSLNFFQLEVYLSKNAWIFNCRLNDFKQFFYFVFDSTRQKWSLLYNKSANNSQKPLLYLSSFHLNCRHNVVLRRATIPTGNTSVLTCNLDNIRGNGVSWWTPKGRISKNRSLPHMTLDKMNNLVIHNAEKSSEGLYLCLFNTTKEKYLIYNIEVKGVSAFLVRKARDILFKEKATEPNFALAVSLSVLITFVCAFCLGAFARPYLESLWRLMRRNKNSGSEHTYPNQAFSDETLSRDSSASKPINMQRNMFICDKNSLGNTQIFPTEASTVYENVSVSGVHSPNPKAEYQKQRNTEINMKKIPVFSKPQTSTDNNESINVYDTGLFFVRTDYQNSNKITPNSRVRNNSALLQSEITKATPDFPERKGALSHNKPRHTRKFMQGRQSCEEQLYLNGNKNIPSGDFISPSSFRRDADIEKLGIYETIDNFPTTEHDCKRIHSDEKDAAADIFGDSSSAEGTPFTMSDCSSLADFEVEHPGVSDNLPVCQSPLDEANTDSGTEKFVTPPESPNNTAELEQTGKNEDENSAYFETTINYGSETTMQDTASPYTDKSSGHVSMSDPDTVSTSSQEIPVTFDYFTNAESTVENSISDFLHNQSTDFGNRVLQLKPFPTYDTEKTSEENELQLSLFPREPQHFLSFSHTKQKENAPAGSTDEDTARNSSEKNHGEADIKVESTEENSISHPFHNESTDFGNMVFKSKPFPTYDTEKTSEEDKLQLSLLPREPQHFLSFSHTEQKENAPPGSTDEHTARNSPEKNHGEADIKVESTEENSISDSFHNESTNFGNMVLKSKAFPTYDTEKTSEEDKLQLSLFPREPQHFLSFSHTEQKENAPAGSRDEHTARNSPEKNHSKADITAESTEENSISDSFHNESTDFGNMVLKSKAFPTYDTEKTSEEDKLQLSLLPREPQHFLSFSHTEQKENAPAGSTDEHTARNFPEKNHGEADIKAESTEENSISHPFHNESTDFGNMVLKLKPFPTYDPEKTSEEDKLQLSLLPQEPQHFLSFSHTKQKENAPAGSTDEHTARNSPEKNHGEADITLQRNMSTSEDNGFIFTPIDTGLNKVVKKPSLLHSSQESSLQLLPEHTAEKHFMFITQEDDLLPQEKQACAGEMQGGSDEKNSDGLTELQESSNHNLPEEKQSCSPTVVLLHLHSSGKTQSEFTTDDPFQLDQSDEDPYSFSIPQGFFNESTPHSSCSFPQKPTGNTIFESTDSSKMKDHTTLTEPENHSAITGEHLQNSSENLSQKSQTNLGQDQFFAKKKRAFDGFANILQSRRTNFNS